MDDQTQVSPVGDDQNNGANPPQDDAAAADNNAAEAGSEATSTGEAPKAPLDSPLSLEALQNLVKEEEAAKKTGEDESQTPEEGQAMMGGMSLGDEESEGEQQQGTAATTEEAQTAATTEEAQTAATTEPPAAVENVVSEPAAEGEVPQVTEEATPLTENQTENQDVAPPDVAESASVEPVAPVEGMLEPDAAETKQNTPTEAPEYLINPQEEATETTNNEGGEQQGEAPNGDPTTSEGEGVTTPQTYEATEKKGLPKVALVGIGVVLLVAIAGASMYFTDSWPFKGDVSEVAMRGAAPEETSDAATEVKLCPTDEYAIEIFDPATCQPIKKEDCLLLFELQQNPEGYLLQDDTLTNVKEWEAACRTLDTTTPETSETSRTVLEVDTSAETIDRTLAPICEENEELNEKRECVCKEGYFLLEQKSAAVNTNLEVMDTAVRETQTQNTCINCEDLEKQITALEDRLNKIDDLKVTEAEKAIQKKTIEEELAVFKKRAAEENCEPEETNIKEEIPLIEIIPEEPDDSNIREEDLTCPEILQKIEDIESSLTAIIVPEVAQELSDLKKQAEEKDCAPEEPSECEKLEATAKDQLAQGQFQESYTTELTMVDAGCYGRLRQCDRKIAYATIAKEYSQMGSLSRPDVVFFANEYKNFEESYYNDPLCVPSRERVCEEIREEMAQDGTKYESIEVSEEEKNVNELDGASDNTASSSLTLSTFDFSESSAPALESQNSSNNTLLQVLEVSQAQMPAEPEVSSANAGASSSLSQPKLEANIEANVEKGEILTRKEYYEKYCPDEEIPPEEQPNIPEEDPVEPPDDVVITTSSTTGTTPVNITTSSTTETTTPETETDIIPLTPTLLTTSTPQDTTDSATIAAINADEATSQPDDSTSDQATITPPAPEESTTTAMPVSTQDLHTAAPANEETLEITQTGPEHMLYLLVLVASQLFIFRRKVYAFAEQLTR